MALFFLTLLLIIFANLSYADHVIEDSNELFHPRYTTAGNGKIPLDDDCALRAFIIEMATYIAPQASKTNWTKLSQSAFQMNQCNTTSHTTYQSSTSAEPFKTASEKKSRQCQQRIFVHDLEGNDLFDGTFEKPLKTIQTALSLTRSLRIIYGSESTLCITIREGTYYLGTNATTTSSQIGVIALTSNDSNLVIENYEDETVILSGGTLLQLEWSIHTKTANGTIMKAQVPDSVNLDEFNELYIDRKRAIVAKYPNGDPSTQGLYSATPGFSFDADSWVPPISIRTVDINVQSPSRDRTNFPNYHISLGGGASVFNPPRNFFGSHNVPRGFTVKNGSLPHLSNWSNRRLVSYILFMVLLGVGGYFK